MVVIYLLIALFSLTASQSLGNDDPWNRWMYATKRSENLVSERAADDEADSSSDEEEYIATSPPLQSPSLMAFGNGWDRIDGDDSYGRKEWAKLVLKREGGGRRVLKDTTTNMKILDIVGMRVFCGRWEVCSTSCILVDSKCPCMRNRALLSSTEATPVYSVRLLEKYSSCN